MQADPSAYRPATPDSPLAQSLYRATSTIDHLTIALANFSRVPSPELQGQPACCCGSEECDATKAWLALRSKLESRLVLSAEVGSALLQRHEAYVRKHEPTVMLRKATQDSLVEQVEADQAGVDTRVAELLKDNTVLEKRLTQALLNSEVTEASNKILVHELEEARSTISRLSAHHARAVGLDSKLSAALQENDDIRQERDSQAQRAKLAEARLATFEDHADKLQAEVRRLEDDLENRHLQRLESSESLIQDVRSKLKGLQPSRVTRSAADEDPEVIQVIKSLVTDNEMLKADNKELYKLLTESREDLQALQQEVVERCLAPPIRVETPSGHSRTSGPSSFAKDSFISTTRRPSSIGPRSRRAYEPLTPETGRRPLSPADSLSAAATKCSSRNHSCPPIHLSLDMDNALETGQGPLQSHQASKAVQTDRGLGLLGINQLSPTFMDHSPTSLHDGHSDSSSLLDGVGSPISSLLECMHSLLHRMSRADALTLTNRLKRQHLRGADVKHLSRTTVSNILLGVSHLRSQYRVWLEDEKMTSSFNRKDLRGLFKLFRELLEEMGQMRVTLNDVILEPSIAFKVSEMAMDPAKAEAMEKERKVIGFGIGASWMAPFSKLFGTSSHSTIHLPSATRTPPRPTIINQGNAPVSRSVLKTTPALSASVTTVNVEFSGVGTGKSVTSVFSAHPDNAGAHSDLPVPHSSLSTSTNAHSLMGIFAGAQQLDDVSEPWVVLPRAPRHVQSTFFTADPAGTGTATIGRSARKRKQSLLSRDVDAILVTPSVSSRDNDDSEVDDHPGPLLERALRRRGLSDSSLRSTFMNQGGAVDGGPVGNSVEQGSVLRTLSRTVQNFKQVASHTISGVVQSNDLPSQPSTASSPSDHHPPTNSSSTPRHQSPRVSPPTLTSLIPSLTSWAAAGVALESTHPPTRSVYGSIREDAGVARMLNRGRDI